VSITEPATLSAASANSQTSCYGTSDGGVFLAVSGGAPNYTIAWNNGQNGATLTGLSAGWYTYTITDANGCSLTDSTQVLQPDPLEVFIDTIPATCIRSFDGQVNVTAYGGNGSYRYYLNDNEFNGFQQGLGTTDIYIHVVDQVGCDTVVRWEMPPLYDPCVFIPNWFSPNGNGEQDLWRIRGMEYEDLKVSVFNVLGQLLYTTTSNTYVPWDGTYNGKDMPAGDYYYVIEDITSGDNYTGYVTILR
jgi:gliding motility-associated-like protein